MLSFMHTLKTEFCLWSHRTHGLTLGFCADHSSQVSIEMSPGSGKYCLNSVCISAAAVSLCLLLICHKSRCQKKHVDTEWWNKNHCQIQEFLSVLDTDVNRVYQTSKYKSHVNTDCCHKSLAWLLTCWLVWYCFFG